MEPLDDVPVPGTELGLRFAACVFALLELPAGGSGRASPGNRVSTRVPSPTIIRRCASSLVASELRSIGGLSGVESVGPALTVGKSGRSPVALGGLRAGPARKRSTASTARTRSSSRSHFVDNCRTRASSSLTWRSCSAFCPAQACDRHDASNTVAQNANRMVTKRTPGQRSQANYFTRL